MRLRVPTLHVVTNDAVVAREDFVRHARRILERYGPYVAVHLRAPGASGRRLYALACAILDPALDHGWLQVNDRVDVALAAGIEGDNAGVHLGARGLLPADAVRVHGRMGLLGVSVHSAAEAHAASRQGADYVLAGTIWETPSHPGRAGAGTALIREIARAVPSRPVIAIGGVTPERVAEARQAGAGGVAMIGGVWDAPDPQAAVGAYLAAWSAAGSASEDIHFLLNGDWRYVPERLTVTRLLERLERRPDEVAVWLAGHRVPPGEMDGVWVEACAALRVTLLADGSEVHFPQRGRGGDR